MTVDTKSINSVLMLNLPLEMGGENRTRKLTIPKIF